MASIRASLNLEQTVSCDDNEKPFLFVVNNVPLELETEDIQHKISLDCGQVKVYRAYKKDVCYITFMKTEDELKLA